MGFVVKEETLAGRTMLRTVLLCDVPSCGSEVAADTGDDGVVVIAAGPDGARGTAFACDAACGRALLTEAGEGAVEMGLRRWWASTAIELGMDDTDDLFAGDDEEPPRAVDLAQLLDDLAPRVPAGLSLVEAIRQGYIHDGHIAAAW